MRSTLRVSLCALAAILLSTVSSPPTFAQTSTTGTLTGLVTDDQGGILPGADAMAVHQPTGTTYHAVSGANGRFRMLNVKVGGPYNVSVKLAGFKEQSQEGIVVALGEETALSFRMGLESVTETITVTAMASSIFTGSKAGAGTSVETQTLENLPTLNRSLADFTRLSPFVNANPNDEGPANISIAGRHYRYNNVQIDGAVNSDLFGLSDSATPGGQTEVQPISLDAIQELQVAVSPYDVRQGGFAGGGVNAITRSGTNALRGTAYYYWRDQALVGRGPTDTPVGDFTDKEGGASIGGPIAKNTAFYFANFEIGRRNTPSGYSVDGQSGIPFGFQPEAQRMRDILKNKYGYDPGGFEQYIRQVPNNKFFLRGDVNFGRNVLTVRDNYIDASNDRGFPTSTLYLMPDNFYEIRDNTNSFVTQLNSTMGTSYNELRVSYQTIRDRRDGPTEFPALDVRIAGVTFNAGREQSSTANELDQDVLELNDDFTVIKGTHTLTLGTHNEFFTFRNLFIQNLFGFYRFDSLDLLEQGLAQQYDHSFSATADPRQAAKFSVYQFGVYAGDQWRVRPKFTLTYGVRFDYPHFPDKPSRNPVSEQYFGYRTDVVPSSQMISPRVGFNWDFSGAKRQQLRGGVGLFAGRTPYVWLSNQYGNTGIDFTRLSVSYRSTNQIRFIPDPSAQYTNPSQIPGASVATNEIDLVDPDYQYPSLVRGNLGYDRELFSNTNVSVEFVWGIVINDILYRNLNLTQTGTRINDGRPVYSRPVPTLSNVILLTNTDQGDQYAVAVRLNRPFRNGFTAGGSYTYNDANSVHDGTSSTAASQWGNVRVPGDPNDPPLTRSHFSTGHRITLAGSYQIPLPRDFSATVSLYYNGQSGRAYSLTFNGDANGDTRTSNDTMYVPRNPSEITVTNGTWEDLQRYIAADECLAASVGTIVERNCARGPWTNALDFRLALGVPIARTKLDFTFDLINVLNVFGSDNGVIRYPAFWNILPVIVSVNSTTGLYNYNLAPMFRDKFTIDNLRSRWQGKFGLRWRF